MQHDAFTPQLLPRLELLNLENNRLTVPSLDFRYSTSLRALLLGLNPLEYIPTLGPLTALVQVETEREIEGVCVFVEVCGREKMCVCQSEMW